MPSAALGDNPLIELTNPFAVISGNVPAVGEMRVGSNAPGQVNEIAGSLSAGVTYIGAGSAGTFNLANPNGFGSAGAFTGLKRGFGSYDASVLWLGNWPSATGTGLLNINTTGSFTTGESHLGGGGTGTVNMDGGTGRPPTTRSSAIPPAARASAS